MIYFRENSMDSIFGSGGFKIYCSPDINLSQELHIAVISFYIYCILYDIYWRLVW